MQKASSLQMARSGAKHASVISRPSRSKECYHKYMLKTSDVAKQLKVSARTIQRWADKKIIKATVLPSGHRRFDETEVNKIKQGE